MKKLIFSFSILLLAAATWLTTTSATRFESRIIVRIEQFKTEKAIEVQLANLQHQYTEVAILGANGKRWFSESVRHANGYSKKLDLSRLPAGDYRCVVSGRRERHVRSFRVSR